MFVRPFSRLKLSFPDGKLIGACSPLTSMQKLGSQPVVGCRAARGPNCPSSWRSAQRFDLIPVSVSGESVQDGGGVEHKVDRAGTPRRDMMNVLLGCAQDPSLSHSIPLKVCVQYVSLPCPQRFRDKRWVSTLFCTKTH